MVTPIEAGLVLVVLVVLFGVFRVIRAVKPLILNAVIGLLVLLGAGLVGLGVQITPVVVLLVAFGGVPAAVLVIILAHIGVVFQTAVILF